jgi:flagellar biosynthesis/type III secretory pathway protein FliH
MMAHTVPNSPFIVRGDILRAHKDAQAILAEARDEASRLRAELLAERLGVLEKAHQQGLKQGLAEAAAVAANAADAIGAFWKKQENELTEVAFAIAHRIVASLPANAILAQLASKAIADHGADVHITLRTAPDAAIHLREFFKNNDHAGRVTVLADPTAAPGECTLFHRRGRANLGLLAQFRAMMSGLPDRPSEPQPKR